MRAAHDYLQQKFENEKLKRTIKFLHQHLEYMELVHNKRLREYFDRIDELEEQIERLEGKKDDK